MKIQAVSDVREPSKPGNSNGSGSSFGAHLEAAKVGQSSAAADLQAYVDMTPAQRLRASVLQALNVTESELASMSPEERKAIEDKIAALIKEKVAQDAEKKGLRIG